MAFAAASDPFVRFAWIAGLASFALSAALVLQVLWMRARLARRERRREAVIARWRPVLYEVVAGGSPRLTPVPPEDEESFLLVWNQLQDGIRGAARTRLAGVGEALGAHGMALRRLGGGGAVGRVLALRTLGHLGRPEDRDEVLRWLDDPRSYVSLAAARALVQTDPEVAPDELLPRLARRADWPVPLFATVLAETSRSRLSTRFREVCSGLTPQGLVRLLPLASLVEPAVVDALLSSLLAAEQDPEVLAGALRHARSPALLPAVRRAAHHGRWSVRVQAAAALGRAGEPADRDLLVELLGDPEWWVRYRAAHALAARPYGSADELVALAVHLGDRYARDIVRQALAEGRA